MKCAIFTSKSAKRIKLSPNSNVRHKHITAKNSVRVQWRPVPRSLPNWLRRISSRSKARDSRPTSFLTLLPGKVESAPIKWIHTKVTLCCWRLKTSNDWWHTKIRCLRAKKSSKTPSLECFASATTWDNSSLNSSPKVTSILTRWLIILPKKKYKPNALLTRKISKKWMVSCSRKLSATWRLRCSSMRSRMHTVLLRQA